MVGVYVIGDAMGTPFFQQFHLGCGQRENAFARFCFGSLTDRNIGDELKGSRNIHKQQEAEPLRLFRRFNQQRFVFSTKSAFLWLCLNKFIKIRYDINEAQVLHPGQSFSGTVKRVKEVKPFRIILISLISIDRPISRKFYGIIKELVLLLTKILWGE